MKAYLKPEEIGSLLYGEQFIIPIFWYSYEDALLVFTNDFYWLIIEHDRREPDNEVY